MNRRQLLGVLGTAATAGLAGCEGSENESTGNLPAYAAWFRTDLRQTAVIKTNFARTAEIESYDIERGSLSESETTEDGKMDLGETFSDVESLAEGYPAQETYWLLYVLAISELIFPFLEDAELANGSGDAVETPVMTVESMMVIGDIRILEGPVTENRLSSRAEVTEVDTVSSYTIYETTPTLGESTEGDADGSADGSQDDATLFAVDDETVVFLRPGAAEGHPPSDREMLELPLDEERDGVDVGSGDLSWALDYCGDGALVYGVADEEIDEYAAERNKNVDRDNPEAFDIEQENTETFLELLSGSLETLVMVVDRHEEGRVTRSALTFESESETPDSDEIATVLADTADETDVVTDGNRVGIEVVWK